jgi:DNA repair exonuclease SbcCD ATPase subunit
MYTGVILLIIHRMTATFGKLQGRTLELNEGLNILQAPNETGKSTWCAFLLSMLYGINSRERERAGFIPDKIRYAPWSGTSMSGRMDCRIGAEEVTLIRSTRRQTAPMGDFQAFYAQTSQPFPDLTGQTCGETLLGVSREVYERSAFIRQSGLPITQDAGLERRIAALISSGEEDTSYSEAADALKKQLNRRRHNRTGQLPALEAELAETRRQLEEAAALEGQLASARTQAEALARQEALLEEELRQLERWENSRRIHALDQARDAARQARQEADALLQQLQADRIPENDAIGRLRGAIVNLETTRKAVEKTRSERDDSLKALLKAEAAVNESPFAGQTPEQARREAAEPPPPARWNRMPELLTAIAGIIAAPVLFYIVANAWDGSPLQKPLSLAALLFGLGAAFFCARHLRRRAIQTAQAAALTRRFGTADPAAITALAETYAGLCQARDDAQAEADRRSAAADTLYNTLSSNEQAILLEIRRFAPAAFDISTADQLLRNCAVRRKALAEAEAAAQKAALQAGLLAQQAPAAADGEPPVSQPPARDRKTVEAELARVRSASETARSAQDRLRGQLHVLGDPVVLESAVRHLQKQISRLEGEYDALRLAMDALERANTALQNRFSPALGRRTAEIFSALTGQRYSSVVLDRTFRLSAEPAGEGIYRDAGLLSAGTADQLYLAARLAICDLVLPPEQSAPIVLDDALANFDDERCRAALLWLEEAARHRQILLFTCHGREAALAGNRPDVSIQRLTETP